MLSLTNPTDTLESYFPNWETSGAIFTQMQSMPWSTYATPLELDILYLGSNSGIKLPASIVRKFSTDHVADSVKLASILKTMYQNQWQHLWDAYVSEYSPLAATDITEQETRSLEGSHSLTKSGSSQKTAGDTLTLNTTTENTLSNTLQTSRSESTDVDNTTTVTDNTQTAVTGTDSTNQSTENQNYAFGFNTTAESPVPESKATGTSTTTNNTTNTTTNTGTTTTVDDGTTTSTLSGTDTNTGSTSESRTGTETHAITDNTTDSGSESGSKEEDETITRTRTGNTGMRMYSEILQSEFDLWKFNYFQKVFEDIDRILTLSVFDSRARLS